MKSCVLKSQRKSRWRRGTCYKLIIAEMPSVAAEKAKMVGTSKRETGYFSGSGSLLSWCIRHLIETAMPEKYDAAYDPIKQKKTMTRI